MLLQSRKCLWALQGHMFYYLQTTEQVKDKKLTKSKFNMKFFPLYSINRNIQIYRIRDWKPYNYTVHHNSTLFSCIYNAVQFYNLKKQNNVPAAIKILKIWSFIYIHCQTAKAHWDVVTSKNNTTVTTFPSEVCKQMRC